MPGEAIASSMARAGAIRSVRRIAAVVTFVISVSVRGIVGCLPERRPKPGPP
jgi:hypothetical protein